MRRTQKSAPLRRAAAIGAVPVALAVALGGCAATPEAPHQELALAEASINNAERSGARQYATRELDQAREKLSRARTEVEREEMVSAERLAQQAALDAELAAAMARNEKAQESVREIDRSIQVLREEIARSREGGTR